MLPTRAPLDSATSPRTYDGFGRDHRYGGCRRVPAGKGARDADLRQRASKPREPAVLWGMRLVDADIRGHLPERPHSAVATEVLRTVRGPRRLSTGRVDTVVLRPL